MPAADLGDDRLRRSPYTGNYANFTAEVTIPADAAAGDQQVVLDGKGTDGSDSQLTLDINVQTSETGDRHPDH